MTLPEQLGTIQTALHTARKQINAAEHRLYSCTGKFDQPAVSDTFRELAVARQAINEAIDVMEGEQ